MKHKLITFACSGLLALGFALAAGPANANAVGMARGALSDAIVQIAPEGPVVNANHRDRRWRHHRRDRGWRYHRPRSGFYLEFGRPAPYYARPRYVRPYYPRVTLSRAHVNWCYNRYRSYRAVDNTFQPYHGPRRQCISPYYR
ncbi:BA14K family protein [Nitratireductor sp. ZSWI3]|uniref:BA14K family protein n=1 Tax=Nitratireductor sp. ZSWI3 TaxID=2966359 RepID=UPI00214F9F7E|nr:BA14K family protein [Nitratireductor sp. ZSWI3]MCR4268047.1 BA14K family protein [Nitratireductor sp. ZSWI3]